MAGTIIAFTSEYDPRLFDAYKLNGDSIRPIYDGRATIPLEDLEMAKLIFVTIHNATDYSTYVFLRTLDKIKSKVIPLCGQSVLDHFESRGSIPPAIKDSIKLPIKPNALMQETARFLMAR